MSARWEEDTFAAALGLEGGGRGAGAEAARADAASAGCTASADLVPECLLVGPYCQTRDAALAWWERAYVRALAARNNGEIKRMAVDAGISPSYAWKLTKR